MKKEIHTSIEINATPEKIWSILSNFGSYPDWNPFIRSITGEVKEGHQIKVSIQPTNAALMTFKPTVLSFKTNTELRWIGKLLISGLFDGEHKFELIAPVKGPTTLIQSEKFKGILVGLFNLENTKNGFIAMNQKLKELAEES